MTKIIIIKESELLTPEDLGAVASGLASCKIAAFPTDTVYGLASTGLIKAALRRIYEVKGRDSLKPLPILIHSAAQAKRWVEWTPAADALAKRFWPGALTLVLRPTKEGRLLTFQEFPTLAVRVPAHPVALQILEAAAVPLASTSANVSGRPALSSGSEVARAFEGRVDFIVDAGTSSGKESTLVDATSLPVRVLREGAVSREAVLEALSAAA